MTSGTFRTKFCDEQTLCHLHKGNRNTMMITQGDKHKDQKTQISLLCSNQIYISKVSQNRHNQPGFTQQKRGNKFSTFGL